MQNWEIKYDISLTATLQLKYYLNTVKITTQPQYKQTSNAEYYCHVKVLNSCDDLH